MWSGGKARPRAQTATINFSLPLIESLKNIAIKGLLPALDELIHMCMEEYNVGFLPALVAEAQLTETARSEGIGLQAFYSDTHLSKQGLIFRVPSIYCSTPLNMTPNLNKTNRQDVHIALSIYDLFYLSNQYKHPDFIRLRGSDRCKWLDVGDFNPQSFIISLLKYYRIKAGTTERLNSGDILRLNRLGCRLEDRADHTAWIKGNPVPEKIDLLLGLLCGTVSLETANNLYECVEIMLALSQWEVTLNYTKKILEDHSAPDPVLFNKSLNIQNVFAFSKARITAQRKTIESRIRYYSHTSFSSAEETKRAPGYLKHWQEKLEQLNRLAAQIEGLKAEFESAMRSQETTGAGAASAGTQEAIAGGSGGAAVLAGAQLSVDFNSPLAALSLIKAQVQKALNIITEEGDASRLFAREFFPEGHTELHYTIDESLKRTGIVLGLQPQRDILTGENCPTQVLKFEGLNAVLLGPHTDLVSGDKTDGRHKRITLFLEDLRITLQFYLRITTRDSDIPMLSEKDLLRLEKIFPHLGPPKVWYYASLVVAQNALPDEILRLGRIVDEIFPRTPGDRDNLTKQNEQAKALWERLLLLFELENKSAEAQKLIEELLRLPGAVSADSCIRLFEDHNIFRISRKVVTLAEKYQAKIETEISTLKSSITKDSAEISVIIQAYIGKKERQLPESEDEATRANRSETISAGKAYLLNFTGLADSPSNLQTPNAKVLGLNIDDSVLKRINNLKLDCTRLIKLQSNIAGLRVATEILSSIHSSSPPRRSSVSNYQHIRTLGSPRVYTREGVEPRI